MLFCMVSMGSIYKRELRNLMYFFRVASTFIANFNIQFQPLLKIALVAAMRKFITIRHDKA